MSIEKGDGDISKLLPEERKLTSIEVYIAGILEEDEPLHYNSLLEGGGSKVTSDDVINFFYDDGRLITVKDYNEQSEYIDEHDAPANFKEDIEYIKSQLESIEELFENPAIKEDKNFINYGSDQISMYGYSAENFTLLYKKFERRLDEITDEYRDVTSKLKQIEKSGDKYNNIFVEEIDGLIERVNLLVEDKEYILGLLSQLINLLTQTYNIQRSTIDNDTDEDEFDE